MHKLSNSICYRRALLPWNFSAEASLTYYVSFQFYLMENSIHINSNSNKFIIENSLTYWGRVTHIWWSQAIIWTNAGILLIGPLRTNFSEVLIEIYTFSFKRVHLKRSHGKLRAFVSLSMSQDITTSGLPWHEQNIEEIWGLDIELQ